MVSYVWGPHLSAPDLDRKKAPVAEQGDDQPAARVGSIRLGMAGRAERQQAVEIEVRAPWARLTTITANAYVRCTVWIWAE